MKYLTQPLSSFRHWYLALAMLLAVPAIAWANTASRTIVQNVVILRVTPTSSTVSYAVEEQLPTGVIATNINESGSWDTNQQKVKWGPFFDDIQRILHYELIGSNGVHGISGAAAFDSSLESTSGDASAIVGAPAPLSTLNRVISGNSIELHVSPEAGTAGYAIEEYIPMGYAPTNITQSGAWDANGLTLRWGPFFDDQARSLAYDITGAEGTNTLLGAGSFDGEGVLATGNVEFVIIPDPYIQWKKDMFGIDWDNPVVSGDDVDHDKDGMRNIDEFGAGTHPALASSVLRISEVSIVTSPDGVELKWASVTGKTYTVWSTLELSAGFTNKVVTGEAATPPENTYLHSGANGGRQYYRVEVEP